MFGHDRKVRTMTAIGPSEVSKSTSAAEAYDRVNREFAEDGEDMGFEYDGRLEDMAAVLRKGKRINPTFRTSSYSLNFRVKKKVVSRVEWYDTVGGSVDPRNSNYGETCTLVRASDAVFVFLSCEDLNCRDPDTIRDVRKRILNTMNILSNVRSGCQVIFCLCKCDLVDSRERREAVRLVRHAMDGSGCTTHGYLITNVPYSSWSPAVPLLDVLMEYIEEDLANTGFLRIFKSRGIKIARSGIDGCLDMIGGDKAW